jgi:hypothetical protein
MINTMLVGLGTTATAVGFFTSETYLKKKLTKAPTSLNHNCYSQRSRE